MSSDKMPGKPVTILLIEDNPGHAELVKRGFTDHRIANQIVHVADGEAALDYLHHRNEFRDARSFPTPQLVLLDLRLPKIDGLEVLQEIKTSDHLKQIPVVVLTTSEAEQDIAKAYQYNANSYLVKPVDFVKFTQLMHDLGFYWLSWNLKPWS